MRAALYGPRKAMKPTWMRTAHLSHEGQFCGNLALFMDGVEMTATEKDVARFRRSDVQSREGEMTGKKV